MPLTYAEAAARLQSLGNEYKTIKLGLDRIRTLLAALHHPETAFRAIHAAGTNGKGSTCAMIESGLRASGLRTGLFTSPHLSEPRERIVIQGHPIAPHLFAQAFLEVHQTALALCASGAIDGHPTFFETVTAMAFVVFRDQRIDVAVIETGLGGRLDATNVIPASLAVITTINFDHMEHLGSTLEAIAAEKAGIIKPGATVILSPQPPQAHATIAERARELNAQLIDTVHWPIEDALTHAEGSRFRTGPLTLSCSLPGEHQLDNARTAARALHAFGIPPAAIETGIAAARWPGRLERVSQHPAIYLDGAHNEAGAEALARYIQRFHANAEITLVFGIMREKQLEPIARHLFPLATQLIFTTPPDQPRAMPPEEISRHPLATHARIEPHLPTALEIARATATPRTTIFITGSLYLVGSARALLTSTPAMQP
ncbi:MAG: bifunctional folylpolyglutamate synthase/dihydrofolate synthase [Acidobacteria bacterium]|nr:bifunctional folylpolyglutamate synthase/dihydrofolate synthase [Acidobacteriota bacterium]